MSEASRRAEPATLYSAAGQGSASPWHLRQAAHSHYRRFAQLTELHGLTEAWIRELQVARSSYNLDRGLGREITDNLWMLQNPSERGLEALLDDTGVEDVLGRLDRTIWSVQAYTLGELLGRAKDKERTVLDSTLEQVCWKLGRESAERHWAPLPPKLRSDVRRLLLAFGQTPFGAGSGGRSYLLQRGTRGDAQIELLSCPHRSPFSEVQRVADELCALHGHWIRGFAYGLNPGLQVTPSSRNPARCGQRWCLPDRALDRAEDAG